MLKEPRLAIDGVPVPLYNVGHGNKLDYPSVFVSDRLDIPENGCSPLEYLQSDSDEMDNIPKKYRN